MAEHKAATSFLNLPNELVLSVAEYLPRQSDISHLRRVSKRTYLCLGNYLLLYNIRHYNSSALLWAAAHNHMEIARWLIRLGADLEPEPDEVYRLRYGLRRGYCHARKTPLDVAVEEGHVHMVKMLTTAPLSKAKVSIQGPLTTALLQGRETIARFLINRLTSIDLPITTASETALEITCNGRLPATMQYLLDKGADPSRCSEQLVTLLPSKDPLKYKLEDDAFEIIKLLCSYGAKFSRKIQDLGLQHKDPRVRHCFNKANTQDPLQSCHNSATSGITETSAYNTQDEDDSGSDHHSFNPGSVFGVNAALAHRDLRKVALELNAIPELPQYDTISFPELSNNALKTDNSAEAYWRRFDRLKLCDIEPETSTIEAPTRRTDPFPALGTSEPRVDNTTQRRWDNLENLNRKSGESPARVSAAFHFQQPEPEPFPALGGRTRQTQSTAPDPWRTLSTAFIPHTRTATITSPSDPNLATSSSPFLSPFSSAVPATASAYTSAASLNPILNQPSTELQTTSASPSDMDRFPTLLPHSSYPANTFSRAWGDFRKLNTQAALDKADNDRNESTATAVDITTTSTNGKGEAKPRKNQKAKWSRLQL